MLSESALQEEKKIAQPGFELCIDPIMVSSSPTDLTKMRTRPSASDDVSGFSIANVNVVNDIVNVVADANVTVTVTKSKKFSSFSVDSLLFKKESKILSGTEEHNPEFSKSGFFRKESATKIESEVINDDDDDRRDSDDELGNYYGLIYFLACDII